MSKLTILALAAVGLSSLCSAQTAALKADMHQVYEREAALFNAKDADAVFALTTPDYKWTLIDGKTLKREDAFKSIKDQFAKTQSGHWHIDIINVLGAGPIVTSVVQYHFEGMMLDDSKKPYKLEFTSEERQNWLKTAAGWRQTSDEVLGQKSKSEGLKSTPNISSSGTISTIPHQAYPSGAGS